MPSIAETLRGALHKEAAQHQTCTVPCSERRATLFFEVRELCAPPPQRAKDVFRCTVRDAGRESHQGLYPAAGLPGAGEDQPAKRKENAAVCCVVVFNSGEKIKPPQILCTPP